MNIHPQQPNHIAFIMDGNRRWAKQRLLPSMMGHSEGAKTLKSIAKAVNTRAIQYMTVYALSTENLKRSKSEIKYLFSLIGKLVNEFEEFVKKNARFRVIGNLDVIPEDVRTSLISLEKNTAHHTGMTLTIAIAYGGKDEIIRAIQKVDNPKTITEETFGQLLDTADMPPVDLIVRTGGHQRLSNFLLWSGAYAELYFTDTLWPAFDEAALDEALAWYREQERNLGK